MKSRSDCEHFPPEFRQTNPTPCPPPAPGLCDRSPVAGVTRGDGPSVLNPGVVRASTREWHGLCGFAWMPTDQVRGLKAHGPSPAKTTEGRRLD